MDEQGADKLVTWSKTQIRRLCELGADKTIQQRTFISEKQRDQAYQETEKQLVKDERAKLARYLADGGKSSVEILCDRISERLISQGFVRVQTPIIISAKALEKMTITAEHPLFKQIFWLDRKQCLRPMLAPNLYSLMQDFARQKIRPVRFFEIGSCFRKETDGANHTREFTMLNLVEMGGEMAARGERLRELGRLIAQIATISSFEFQEEESEVYGTTIDMVSGPQAIEIGSGAMGPHELDMVWGIHEPWVGFGIGIERLVMLSRDDSSIARWCRSTSYLDGIRLKI